MYRIRMHLTAIENDGYRAGSKSEIHLRNESNPIHFIPNVYYLYEVYGFLSANVHYMDKYQRSNFGLQFYVSRTHIASVEAKPCRGQWHVVWGMGCPVRKLLLDTNSNMMHLRKELLGYMATLCSGPVRYTDLGRKAQQTVRARGKGSTHYGW